MEKLAALIMVLGFTILLAGNIVAGGFLFEAFMGTSYATGVLIITLAVFAYSIAGGMFSDTYTSVLQLSVALAGSIALILYVAVEYGLSIPSGTGPSGTGPFAFAQLTDPAAGARINWAPLLSLGLGDIVAIDFVQRVFAAESPETAQKACFAGAAGTLIIGVPFAVVALSANDILAVVGSTADGPVLYALLQDAAPPMLARNVLGVREEREDVRDRLLVVTRAMTVPITLVGIFFAIRVPRRASCSPWPSTCFSPASWSRSCSACTGRSPPRPPPSWRRHPHQPARLPDGLRGRLPGGTGRPGPGDRARRPDDPPGRPAPRPRHPLPPRRGTLRLDLHRSSLGRVRQAGGPRESAPAASPVPSSHSGIHGSLIHQPQGHFAAVSTKSRSVFPTPYFRRFSEDPSENRRQAA